MLCSGSVSVKPGNPSPPQRINSSSLPAKPEYVELGLLLLPF
jgi:hypothetical protein